MKMFTWILLLVCMTAGAQDQYRIFTTQDGRNLKAVVTMYDAISGKLQVQREDGKKVTVPISTFSEKDKVYAESWLAARTFESSSKLQLKITREEVKTTKSDIEVDMSENTGPKGGSGLRLIGTDKNTQYRFILNMKNSAAVPLENLSMEYRLYYAQEQAVLDKERSEKQPDDRPDIYMAINKENVRKSSGKIKPIEARGEKQVATKPVNLLQRTINGRGMENNINLKSDLHGIWIKLIMEGPDGESIVREIAYPPSIPKKFDWDQEETD